MHIKFPALAKKKKHTHTTHHGWLWFAFVILGYSLELRNVSENCNKKRKSEKLQRFPSVFGLPVSHSVLAKLYGDTLHTPN